MGIVTLKPDGSQDQLTFQGMDHPSLYSNCERARRIRGILSVFNETHRTESAFYLEFNKLPEADRTFLTAYWSLVDEWDTFLHLCRHFRIKVA